MDTRHPAPLTSLEALLKPDLIELLKPHFRSKHYKRGEALLRQNELWQQVFLIETGLIRLYFLRSDGREFNKNFYREGQLVCPLTPHMLHKPALFGISCIENCTIWQCSATSFMEILQGHHAWNLVQSHFLSQLVDHKLQREHDLLSLSAKERYTAFCERQPELASRIPLVQLASYLGITDVSLSRLRHAAK
ncbi:Crp/Fnr family transcriptional regulator [Thiolinea disciformis]|uniref:Crp/Fnr family transcriptional regulator n=1 Tax=Thiolinea disciformis TaxID=125614 RepID=UPI000378E9DC|nr:Crp/Fnr family transcriptional regulator [Thiolinea disciformis]